MKDDTARVPAHYALFLKLHTLTPLLLQPSLYHLSKSASVRMAGGRERERGGACSTDTDRCCLLHPPTTISPYLLGNDSSPVLFHYPSLPSRPGPWLPLLLSLSLEKPC